METAVEEGDEGGTVTTTTTTTTTKVEQVVVSNKEASSKPRPVIDSTSKNYISLLAMPSTFGAALQDESSTPARQKIAIDEPNVPVSKDITRASKYYSPIGPIVAADAHTASPFLEKYKVPLAAYHDDPNSVSIGLRVYTHKDVPAIIVRRPRTYSEDEESF